MNARWTGPVTTAASTTLARSHVLATKATPSMALPTVEVSRMPRLESEGAGPVEEQGWPLSFPHWGMKGTFQFLCSSTEPINSREALAKGSLPPLIPLTHQVWNGADRRDKLFSCEFFIEFTDAFMFREWEGLSGDDTLPTGTSQQIVKSQSSERAGWTPTVPQSCRV